MTEGQRNSSIQIRRHLIDNVDMKINLATKTERILTTENWLKILYHKIKFVKDDKVETKT